MRGLPARGTLGRPHPEWFDWAKSYVDRLIQQQRPEGSFPRRWRAGPSAVEKPSGTTVSTLRRRMRSGARQGLAPISGFHFTSRTSRSVLLLASDNLFVPLSGDLRSQKSPADSPKSSVQCQTALRILYSRSVTIELRACHLSCLRSSAINAHPVRYSASGRFVTMVLAGADLESRRLRYVNARHNPPLRITADGGELKLEATGLPLGMFGTATYSPGEITLPSGSVCLFHTDGLAERENRAGEMFGEVGIVSALKASSSRGAEEIRDAVVSAADRFTAGVEPADDTALLVLRVADRQGAESS